MEFEEIAINRLYSQQIGYTKFNLPSEMVSWFGAVQGQDYAGAKWALGLRLGDITDKDVEKAFNSKSIVVHGLFAKLCILSLQEIYDGYSNLLRLELSNGIWDTINN